MIRNKSPPILPIDLKFGVLAVFNNCTMYARYKIAISILIYSYLRSKVGKEFKSSRPAPLREATKRGKVSDGWDMT